jgi:hypothetical protein
MRETVSHRHEFDRHVAVWSRRENIDEARKPFGDIKLMGCPVSIHSWNGRNVRPAMMHFDQVSTLGVVGHESGKPKVSFALNDKPFCGDVWFHTQHLVASVSFIGGLYGDEHFTLDPPFIPELNEFYSRSMHFQYDKLRIESERIGLIIDAADTDTFLYALPVADLVERVFGMAGFSTKPSSAGLIARQLIGQLGGLQGARVFKIPGVRRLLKTYGPKTAFTKKGALQLIAGRDPENPDAKFNDYQELYIETRPIGTKLKPDAVFSHLVEKGLFRIGAELTCSNCRMASWIALDALKQRVSCELCGHNYDAIQQLVNGDWRYRRSGVLGAEKNAQGAVPVALTLQQLDTNIGGTLHGRIYFSSLDLKPLQNAELPSCEVDFLWMIARQYPRKTAVILGECKDQGPIKLNEFEKDIENLRRVADAFPRKRFKTFVLLTKLSPFTPEEIELAKTLNDKYRYRAILLTARELEPYHIYERTKSEFDINSYGGTPEDLAQVTAHIYFREITDGYQGHAPDHKSLAAFGPGDARRYILNHYNLYKGKINMPYYSHVLYFPNNKPFDNSEFKWPSFVGEFIKPIVELNLHEYYWFSYYTTCARFRILTNQYEQTQPHIEELTNQLHIEDKGEEKELTLEQDLACDRFIGNQSKSTPNQRAMLILKSLESTCNLFIDSIYKREDGYWAFEENQNTIQNPTRNHLFSVCHLYHNITGSPGIIASYKERKSNSIKLLSYYYFENAKNSGKLDLEEYQYHPHIGM